MKAIETHAYGCRFRSRLEARHAVLLTTLGVRWEYEKEGYNLGDGINYLPDFYLPDLRCWLEIKGDTPTQDECIKAYRLAQMAGSDVYIFDGEIKAPSMPPDAVDPIGTAAYYYCAGEYLPQEHHQLAQEPFYQSVRKYLWVQCPVCLQVAISFGGLASHLPCGCIHVNFSQAAESSPYGYPFLQSILKYDTTLLLSAYEAARSARFEHGETPTHG